jgi:hypothetical protein
MKALFTLVLLGILYVIGLDGVYLALDTADAALKGAYHHAVAESAARRCTTRTQLPKRTTRKESPDGC